jgi:dephospho-CoA kinase
MSAPRTRVIGLTGGIASGKSTVARILRELGAEVIDADQVARDLVEPGQPALDEIAAGFGREVLDEAGRLDRKKLGAIVFADAEKRRRLNGILHPRIGAETGRRVADAAARGVPVVVYEAALLVENRIHQMLDGLIVVAAPPADQLARLRARDQLDDEEALRRVAAQAPLEEKIAAADFVIDNAGPLDQTRRRTEEVWREILAGAPLRSP